MRCLVRSGTRRDAVLHAVGANATNGLRRTNADKRRAVEILLADEEWSKKSDRWIAEKCGVSNRFVGSLRPATVNGTQLAQRRTGQDGKTRKAPSKPAAPPPPAGDRPSHNVTAEVTDPDAMPSLNDTITGLTKILQAEVERARPPQPAAPADPIGSAAVHVLAAIACIRHNCHKHPPRNMGVCFHRNSHRHPAGQLTSG